jgi:hypothetical protein
MEQQLEGCWTLPMPQSEGETTVRIYFRLAAQGAAQDKIELMGSTGRVMQLTGKSVVMRNSGTWALSGNNEITFSGVLSLDDSKCARLRVLAINPDSIRCTVITDSSESVTVTRVSESSFSSNTLSIPLGSPTVNDYDSALTIAGGMMAMSAQKGDRLGTQQGLNQMGIIAAGCIRDYGYAQYLPMKQRFPAFVQKNLP